jgi:integrase
VQWHILDANPLDDVKLRKIDNARVRYLSSAEEKRLLAALAKRDREAIAGRRRRNKWRDTRGYDRLPALPTGGFADHVTPMVLVALNTGLRRGELTALTWRDVNLPGKMPAGTHLAFLPRTASASNSSGSVADVDSVRRSHAGR